MNIYRIAYTRPYINQDDVQFAEILATSEQQVRLIFADCDIISVTLYKRDYDQALESQINAARIWTSNMHVTDDDMDAVHNYIVAAEAGDRAALAYGDYDLGKPRMIVTSSFAERWTDNPDHYRERFGIDDVEVLDEKRPLEDDEFQSWHDDPRYY